MIGEYPQHSRCAFVFRLAFPHLLIWLENAA
jgi:hypothetical protein